MKPLLSCNTEPIGSIAAKILTNLGFSNKRSSLVCFIVVRGAQANSSGLSSYLKITNVLVNSLLL